MLEVLQFIVRKKPSALVVVLCHVRVPDEQDLVLGKHCYVGDQRVDSAFRLDVELLRLPASRRTAIGSEITCSAKPAGRPSALGRRLRNLGNAFSMTWPVLVEG